MNSRNFFCPPAKTAGGHHFRQSADKGRRLFSDNPPRQQQFTKELGEKYILAEPQCNPLYFDKMPKIFKKGTTYIEIPKAGISAFNMLFIDLFIIENIPKAGITRKLDSLIYNIASKGASVCCDYLYPSPLILEKQKHHVELK